LTNTFPDEPKLRRFGENHPHGIPAKRTQKTFSRKYFAGICAVDKDVSEGQCKYARPERNDAVYGAKTKKGISQVFGMGY
jgi:hypothetical protein